MLENTIENKAKFFALYWGQIVLRYHIVDNKISKPTIIESLGDWSVKNSFIELTPLDQITDEDVLEVAKILNWDCYPKESYIAEIKDWFNDKTGISSIKHKWDCLYIFDYLRSKGYAVPFMGLSVEQLIEYGWIKLKENRL